MTSYDGFCIPSILTGDKGTLSTGGALHWSFTFLFSTRGLLRDVYPLVATGPVGRKTSDILLMFQKWHAGM